jgi:HEPN domain-containing protein
MEALHRYGMHRNSCFWAQQVCEKLLKGAILTSDERPPKTVELVHLLELSGEQPEIENREFAFFSDLLEEPDDPADFANFPKWKPHAKEAERAVNLAPALLNFFKVKYGLSD